MPGAARKRGSCYAGGARAGTCSCGGWRNKAKCCGSGQAPVGIRMDATLAGAGSMAWWLKWQIGQLSGESWHGDARPSERRSDHQREQRYREQQTPDCFRSDTFEGHFRDLERSVGSLVHDFASWPFSSAPQVFRKMVGHGACLVGRADLGSGGTGSPQLPNLQSRSILYPAA